MPERPQRLYVARTGEYLGVLRFPLAGGSGTFLRRDGSIGHIFEVSNGAALYALDDRLTIERVVTRSTGTVRRLAVRTGATSANRARRTA
jgi:hypothetical protein